MPGLFGILTRVLLTRPTFLTFKVCDVLTRVSKTSYNRLWARQLDRSLHVAKSYTYSISSETASLEPIEITWKKGRAGPSLFMVLNKERKHETFHGPQRNRK